MKHIPSIIDYMLLLDYKVSSGSGTLNPLKKEESGIDDFCKTSKDEYYWVRYRAKDNEPIFYYKTPFKKRRKLLNLKEEHVKSLIEMWIRQYLIFSEKAKEYNINNNYLEEISLVKVRTPKMNHFLEEHYGTCLLLYTLLTTLSTQTEIENSIEYIPYTWDNIIANESVIKVIENITGNKVPVKSFSFFGIGGVYVFDEYKDYQVQIKTDSSPITIDYKGKDYAGLVTGFIIDPSIINMIFIEQLVNNEFVYTVNFEGQGQNPDYWGIVKIKRILSQSLSSAVISYYFPIRRNNKPGLITSDEWLSLQGIYDKIIGIEDNNGLIPNYFRFFDKDSIADAMRQASPIYIKNIEINQNHQTAFSQALIPRLNNFTQIYKVLIYDNINNKIQVKEPTNEQRAFYLYNPIDKDIISVMINIFGMRNILKEKTYDCYQSIQISQFLKKAYLKDIVKYWINYADYASTIS
jgi:hypothetical protein